jgi:hypothetical protein
MSRARNISVSTVRCWSLHLQILNIGTFVMNSLGSLCGQGQILIRKLFFTVIRSSCRNSASSIMPNMIAAHIHVSCP